MPALKEIRTQSYNRKQTVTPLTEHVQAEDNHVQIEADNPKPFSPRPGHLVGGFVRPTIAPHSIHAVAVHRFKPITAHTIIKGKGLGSTSPLFSNNRR